MRILCLIPSMGAGGAERTMARLVTALSARHEVTVMTYEGDDCEPFYALPPSVQLVHTGLVDGGGGSSGSERLRRIALRLCTIRRLVRQTAPDVVLSFITTMNITAIGASLGTGVPVLVSERIDPRRHRLPLVTSWLRLLAYTLAEGVVVQTARVRDYFPSWLRRRITVLPNAVPLSAQCARPHVAGPHGRMRIIAIGRLVHQKGFDRLITAFARVSERHPDWDLVIFGEGEDRAALTAQVAELGLSGRVSLPGITERVEDELAASHLMVLPSRYEGFPNALAEAVAAALPTVAFAGVSGVEELVFHESTGLLADDGSDEQSLASSLDRLMGDGELRRRFGAAAREHAQYWPPDIIHAKWEQILMSAAKVGKGTA
jgi:GalNAc-alpha-(1->4)-GalNAc-alpha-(1->3)-diNAcBac-PP-undecaprenol alpha-1,4-N-acetyl-D-galactosaminyltransferase